MNSFSDSKACQKVEERESECRCD